MTDIEVTISTSMHSGVTKRVNLYDFARLPQVGEKIWIEPYTLCEVKDVAHFPNRGDGDTQLIAGISLKQLKSDNCDIFWGSHGCSLKLGHGNIHQCGDTYETLCCRVDGSVPNELKISYYGENDEWREFQPYPGKLFT